MSERQLTDLGTLRRGFAGEVLSPGDAGYDRARSVWNAMVDRRPVLVARCATTDDVVAAVRYGRDNDLEIGVRCGGHGVVGSAVPHGGLMLDLTPMGAARVDPERRRAWVQGGALLGALDTASQPHGLATTAGNVSHTGVGGLTLGGGMGWLARKYGLSCDNVESYEVVTADGTVLRASATEHPDLFWALRGGGGNFGVVTEFEFRLHDVGTAAFFVNLYYPAEQAARPFQVWRDLIPQAPREATLTAWVGTPTGWPELPEELWTRSVAGIGFVWVGAADDARPLLESLRSAGAPVAEVSRELTYLELQTMDDSPEGHAFRRYWKGHYLSELADDAIDTFLSRAATGEDDDLLPAASFQTYGGAIADVADDDSAFSQRDAVVEFVAASRWTNPAEDEARIEAARRYGAAMEPFASGAYVNALVDEGQAGVRRAYRPAKLERLTAVKDRYDPDNVFHLNHNIVPSARS